MQNMLAFSCPSGENVQTGLSPKPRDFSSIPGIFKVNSIIYN